MFGSLRVVRAAIVVIAGAVPAISASIYVQTDLTSDIPGMAPNTDPNLQDPWGVSFSSTSPIWVSDRATGVSTLYNGLGVAVGGPLIVTIPPGTGAAGPTGQVTGSGTTFMVNGGSASFIFDTLGGTIAAWNNSLGTTAAQVASVPGARFEGLAQANNTLYAANFVSGGAVDVFNSSYAMTNSFTDPSVPAGYAPFNVQNIGGNLYVEYALTNATAPVPLPGNGGFVDVFSPSGTLINRLISDGALDAPWGVALAPSNFGDFSNDLLVGNFGNGEINAFNPVSGAFIGTIDGPNGAPLVNDGLWSIFFGNGAQSTSGSTLYFTAGINGGRDGLMGAIDPAPEPSTVFLFAGAAALLLAGRRLAPRRSRPPRP